MRRMASVALAVLLLLPATAAQAVVTITLGSNTLTRTPGQTLYDLDLYVASDAPVSLSQVTLRMNVGAGTGVLFAKAEVYNPAITTPTGLLFSGATFATSFNGYSSGGTYSVISGASANQLPEGVGAVSFSAVSLGTTPAFFARVRIDTTSVPDAGGPVTLNFESLSGNDTDFRDTSNNPLALTSTSTSLSISAVPEPSSIAALATMVGVGLPLLVWQRRHARRRAAQRKAETTK